MAGSLYMGQDQTVQEGDTTTLQGYFFGDLGTHAVQWQWAAKSSTGAVLATGSDSNFAFTPSDDGLYDLVLCVLDNAGDTITDSVQIRATNVPPKLTVTGDAKVAADVPYQLALSSFDPGADAITSWTIDWGDGTAPETFAGNPTSVSHIYNGGSNRYAILATAADEDANYAATGVGVGVTQFDPTFGNDGEVKIGFNAVVPSRADNVRVRSDGKVLVAGRKVTGSNDVPMISLFQPNGTLDTSFGTDGIVILEALGAWSSNPLGFAVDAYDRILIGGAFGMARLSTDGHLDPTFGVNGLITNLPGFNGVQDIAVDSQHRIVARNYSTVLRLLSNGDVDRTFNQGQPVQVSQSPSFEELKVDANDRIVLVGRSYRGSSVDAVVVRLTSAGSSDSAFGTLGSVILDFGNRDSYEMALTFVADTILVAAQARNGDSTSDLVLTRLLDNGAPDTRFGVGGQVATFNDSTFDLEQLHVGSDGAMYVAGSFGWAKFGANGNVLGRANNFPIRNGKGIVTDSQQNVYVVGGQVSGGSSYSIAKYLPDSSLDMTFGLADNDLLAGMATLEATGPTHDAIADFTIGLDDGSILVVGRQTSTYRATVIAKYDHSGQLDLGFGSKGYLAIPGPTGGEIRGLKIDKQNRILVLVEDAAAKVRISRFFSDGTPDNSFGVGADNITELPDVHLPKLQLMPDGAIIILGLSRWPNSVIVKLDGETGQLVSSFGVGGKATFNLREGLGVTYSEVTLMDAASDSQGRILVTGMLSRYPGSSPAFVARFHANGTLDESFGVGKSFDTLGEIVEDKAGLTAIDLSGWYIDAIAVDRSDRIIVAGGRTAARFTEAGELDPTFRVQGSVAPLLETGAIAFDANDRIFISGYGIVKLLNDGSPDDSFAPGGYLALSASITRLATDNSGRLVIGGYQFGPQRTTDFYLARIVPSTAEIYVEVTSSGPTLAVPPLVVGANSVMVTGATPGTVVHLVLGAQPGLQLLSEHGATVGILGAVIAASGVANASRGATLQVNITAEQLEDIIFLQAFDMSPAKKLTNVISIGSPLLSKNGEGWITETNNVSPALRAEALARWQASGLTDSQMAKLRSATISMVDLPVGILGQTVGNKIYLDSTAAGYGWFLDTTPGTSHEFLLVSSAIERSAAFNSLANGKMDLLTVLMHEMGHVLGQNDLHTEGRAQLMSHALPTSTRRFIVGTDPYDVTADGIYAPEDVLLVINALNTYGSGPLRTGINARLDVNGDGVLAPYDALLLINFLNSGYAGAQGENTSASSADALAASSPAAKSMSSASQSASSLATDDWQAYWMFYSEATTGATGKSTTDDAVAADEWFQQLGV